MSEIMPKDHIIKNENRFIRNCIHSISAAFFSRNRYRLAKLNNIHKDKRAFIIGTGPSLCLTDIDKLKDEVTFGCNKIYLSFNETTWRPTYYSVIDRIVAQNNCDLINELKLKKIFSNVAKPYFKNAKDVIWLNDLKSPTIQGERKFLFSKNAGKGIYGGFTVIYTQLQLAFYMGIKEVYLLGIDFDFKESQRTGEKTSAGEVLLKSDGEVNHFHSGYRQPGELWTIPRLDYQYKAFQIAKISFEEDNRCIYNASRRTKLDVFPIIDLDRII